MRNPTAFLLARPVLNRDRSLPHLRRKFYHFMMGTLCFSLYAFFLDRVQALWVLGVLGGSFVLLDLMRLSSPKMNALTLRLFGPIMRREEMRSVTGNSFFVFGLLTVVVLFPQPIVLLSVAFLAVGDPIAAVVGTLYGKHKIVGKKSLEGALANFVCSWAAAFLIGAAVLGLPAEKVVVLAWAGALCSVAAELLPLPIDDNFTIPVFSAIFLSIVNVFVPLF